MFAKPGEISIIVHQFWLLCFTHFCILIFVKSSSGYVKEENYWTGYLQGAYLIHFQLCMLVILLCKHPDFRFLLKGWEILWRRCQSCHGAASKRDIILSSSRGCSPWLKAWGNEFFLFPYDIKILKTFFAIHPLLWFKTSVSSSRLLTWWLDLPNKLLLNFTFTNKWARKRMSNYEKARQFLYLLLVFTHYFQDSWGKKTKNGEIFKVFKLSD